MIDIRLLKVNNQALSALLPASCSWFGKITSNNQISLRKYFASSSKTLMYDLHLDVFASWMQPRQISLESYQQHMRVRVSTANAKSTPKGYVWLYFTRQPGNVHQVKITWWTHGVSWLYASYCAVMVTRVIWQILKCQCINELERKQNKTKQNKKQNKTKQTTVMIFKDMCFLDIKYICLIVACDLPRAAQ